jgi:hypothetical protein
MRVQCKTCEQEFTPPRKNVLNCRKCIGSILKNKPEKKTLKKHQKANTMMMKRVKVMNKMRCKPNQKYGTSAT